MLVAIAVAILGCEQKSEEHTRNYDIPKGLEDCKIHKLKSPAVEMINLHVVRCPNSSTSTTYRSGKSTYSVTVLD
jgi:hypothetical protein